MSTSSLSLRPAISLAFLLVICTAQPPVEAVELSPQRSPEVVRMNNKAVTAINAGDLKTAIQILEEALRLDPSYKLAKENLSMAYNNLALKTKDEPLQALKYFHLALMIDPANHTTQDNFDTLLSSAESPVRFDDVASAAVDYADAALKADNYKIAIAEATSILKSAQTSKSRQANPIKIRALNVRANAYEQSGRGTEADQDRSQAKDLANQLPSQREADTKAADTKASDSSSAADAAMPKTDQSSGGVKTDVQKMYARIGPVEQKLFGKQYNTETIADRLARLERKLFKSAQSGTLLQRLDQVMVAADNVPAAETKSAASGNSRSSGASAEKLAAANHNKISQYAWIAAWEEQIRQGQTQLDAGQYDDASKTFQAAITRLGTDEAGARRKLVTNMLLAEACEKQKDYAQSLKLLSDCESTLQQKFPSVEETLVDCQARLADIDYAQGQTDEGKKHFQQALTVGQSYIGSERTITADLFKDHNTATDLKISALCKSAAEKDGQQKFDDAAKDYADMLDATRAYVKHGAGNELVADCCYNAAMFYNKQNKPAQAAAALRLAMDEFLKCGWAAKVDTLDFGTYMADLQKTIKTAWTPAKSNSSTRTKVAFRVHRLGFSNGLKVTNCDGGSAHEDAALLAVLQSDPFVHLPRGAPEIVDIEYTFDYNVKRGRDF
jgi:tetratricopeptide (TPR) repeat protein